jgi:hypothetical protein
MDFRDPGTKEALKDRIFFIRSAGFSLQALFPITFILYKVQKYSWALIGTFLLPMVNPRTGTKNIFS